MENRLTIGYLGCKRVFQFKTRRKNESIRNSSGCTSKSNGRASRMQSSTATNERYQINALSSLLNMHK